MKKYLACLLTGVMAVSMAACGSSSAAQSTAASETVADVETQTEETVETTESAATEERTTFTVGFDAAFPPYGYLDEATGDYVGFDLDLAAEVCERNGWELVKTPIDWDAKDMELNSGAIDCIWNGFTMNGREAAYAWSEPYVDNSQVVVVAADSGISSLEDLAGKVVLVQADSSALSALEGEELADLTATFASLDQVPEYNTAFLNMEAGAADAVAMDIGVAEYQVASRGDAFVILDETLSKEQYGIGFALGNEALRDQVQATLDEMAADGTVAKIAEEWGLADAVCIGK